MTGTTRRISSSSGTGEAPGRVLSPPTSTKSAPVVDHPRRRRRPRLSGRRCGRAFPENESGVTFKIPMTRVSTSQVQSFAVGEGERERRAVVRREHSADRRAQRLSALPDSRLAPKRSSVSRSATRIRGLGPRGLGLAVEHDDAERLGFLPRAVASSSPTASRRIARRLLPASDRRPRPGIRRRPPSIGSRGRGRRAR